MTIDLELLKAELCHALCANVTVHRKNNNLLFVETPFTFPDGDTYCIYLQELTGGIRITDCGHTLMHLSYEMDIDKLREKTRGRIFEQILSDIGLNENKGQFYLDSTISDLGSNLFRFGQALTKIYDLSFLNRFRVESTFYDDLYDSLAQIVGADHIEKEFIYPNMPKAKDYPIDFNIKTKEDKQWFFVFGIPNKDKARLVTIVLEHLLRENADFDSLLVFTRQEDIPRPDLMRLLNVGGEMVSFDAQEDFKRKVTKRAA